MPRSIDQLKSPGTDFGHSQADYQMVIAPARHPVCNVHTSRVLRNRTDNCENIGRAVLEGALKIFEERPGSTKLYSDGKINAILGLYLEKLYVDIDLEQSARRSTNPYFLANQNLVS
ncbi:hypothetical protein TWF718_005227 [Orbilia javanica]|uniref:Uncharacterized protein n=1 Tax=Orbilia javanica TaxID=47235 RepID=A0AAN8MPN6_9PEZI